MESGSTRLVLNSQLSHRLFVRHQASHVVSASPDFLKKKGKYVLQKFAMRQNETIHRKQHGT